MYAVELSDNFGKIAKKLMKRNRGMLNAVYRKVAEIAENPYHYKPLRAPMQGLRGVHIMGCFVLTYSIDENAKTIKLVDFDHHDNVY
jgi:mRNA interferase RelE/StbE/toxin YoeB